MGNVNQTMQKRIRSIIDSKTFTSYDLLTKIIILNNFDRLIIAQRMMIEDSNLPDEKLNGARERLSIMQETMMHFRKIYEEGQTAINLNSHLSLLNLHLECDNRELKAENEKLKNLIEAWKD